MRGFFLLLLLTNVVFLVWQYQHRGTLAESGGQANVHFSDEGLTLLSELSPEARPALRDEVAEQAPRARPVPAGPSEPLQPAAVERDVAEPLRQQVCLRVSGIEEQALLDRLSSQLAELGATALQQGSEQGHKVNYWVMLPPYASRDKATEAASILRQQRMRDFFIVRSGDYENAVSLGVFSTRERAKRRYDQIAGLKARLRRPRIESIELPTRRYWLSFAVHGKELQRRAQSLLAEGPGLKREEIRCK